jgi:hypothetical protein
MIVSTAVVPAAAIRESWATRSFMVVATVLLRVCSGVTRANASKLPRLDDSATTVAPVVVESTSSSSDAWIEVILPPV